MTAATLPRPATSPRRIATVRGVMLTPGVSRNNRLYRREVIAKAVARMQERIHAPDGLPVVMRTHHGAGDDSRLIVGRVTACAVDETGAATYAADLYDTAPGRDIASLVTADQPALRSVSISGAWLGPVRRAQADGVAVETADDLEIDAVDWTATPGVTGAVVTGVAVETTPPAPAPDIKAVGGPDQAAAETAPSGRARTPLSETVEALIALPEQATPAGETPPAGVLDTTPPVEAAVSAPSVDPPPQIAVFTRDAYPTGEAYTAKQKRVMVAKGQAMRNAKGDPSYPIKTKADLRKAIKAVGRGGADHDDIRRHIIDRANALGLTDMIPDTWNSDGSLKTAKESAASAPAGTRFSPVVEMLPGYGGGPGGLEICAVNGPTTLRLCVAGIEPGELAAVADAAMDAACAALSCLDPDLDGDLDVAGAPDMDADGDADDLTDDGCADQADRAGGEDGGGDNDMENVVAALAAALAPHLTTTAADGRESHPTPSMRESAVDTTEPVQEAAVSAAAPTPTPATPAVPAAPAVAEATPPPAPTLTAAQIAEAVAAGMGAQTAALAEAVATQVASAVASALPKPPAEPPAPATPAQESATPAAPEPVAEATVSRADLEAIRESLKAELREQLRADGLLPGRRGYRVIETNGGEPTREELYANRANALLGDFGLKKTEAPASA